MIFMGQKGAANAFCSVAGAANEKAPGDARRFSKSSMAGRLPGVQLQGTDQTGKRASINCTSWLPETRSGYRSEVGRYERTRGIQTSGTHAAHHPADDLSFQL